MAKIIDKEEISGRWAKVYAMLAKKNPMIRDQFSMFAQEITTFISSGSMLDVGTGQGYLPIEIAQLAIDLKITGVDLSSTMVKIASDFTLKNHLSNRLEFIQANASNLPFADNYFDFICSTASIHHWAEPVKSLKEIIRVLKPGCEIWIYDLMCDKPTHQAKLELIKRYGRIRTFHFLNLIKKKNSIYLDKIKEFIREPGISEHNPEIENKGVLFKLRLVKRSN